MTAETPALPVLQGVRATVLGASGFIGAWVARCARDAGADVTAIARTPAGAARIERFVGGDVRVLEEDLDPTRMEALLARTGAQIVFNMAGYGVDPTERDEATARRINVDLVGAVCAALERSESDGWTGLRLVHVGSALEYGEARGDLNEDTTEVATTLYGTTKLDGTREVRSAHSRGLAAITARLFTVYGPGEHPGRLLPTLRAAGDGDDVIELTEGRQLRDFTYAGDVAEGVLRLASCTAHTPSVVNLATGHLTSVRTVVKTYAEVLDIARERLHFGALPTRVEEMAHHPVNIERLRTLLGWVPSTTVRDGLRRTAASGASGSGE